jgi:hypothetical protein
MRKLKEYKLDEEQVSDLSVSPRLSINFYIIWLGGGAHKVAISPKIYF